MARSFWVALILAMCSFASLPAQEAAEDPAEPTIDSKPAAGDNFNEAIEKWRTIIAEIRKLQQDYRFADEKQLPQIRRKYREVLKKGTDLLPEIEAAAYARLEAKPGDPDALAFLFNIAKDGVESDNYYRAYPAVEKLVESKFDEKKLLRVHVQAAFGTNHFKEARAAYEKLLKLGIEPDDVTRVMGEAATPELIANYEQELEKRAAEKEADDLPRVLLKTSKGDIVLELYENEAPDTVGNFVSLVEKGFYNKTPFHRVLPQFMAQGGDPTGSGSGGPGYKIFCECYKDDIRRHFAGTLSMAHAGKNTGGSQFFLTFIATSFLDGKHTVFGRVIEGYDTLAKIQKRDPNAVDAPTPDVIIEAKVLRKRDHKYEPNKAS